MTASPFCLPPSRIVLVEVPVIYEDRTPQAVLEKNHPEILQILAETEKGKTGSKDRVHFCGLAHASAGDSVFFLPRNIGGSEVTPDGRTALAKLTMRAMARYGRETVSRTGSSADEGDHSNLVSVVEEIASDFFRYGIYSERTRIKGRNSGKPDWKRTIQTEIPMISADGDVVYSELRTSRSLDSHDNPLSRIQAAILREILGAHSWWLEGPAGAHRQLAPFNAPIVPRALWANSLKSLLPGLYANRPVSLVKSLLRYLYETAQEKAGSFLFGVEDFERVWEEMLRQVLPNVLNGKLNLPKPGYKMACGKVRFVSKGLLPDIIVKKGNKIEILDAKYYDANSIGGMPGTPDISKQTIYELAIRSMFPKNLSISNAFVFPSSGRNKEAGYLKEFSDVEEAPQIYIDQFNSHEFLKAGIYDVENHTPKFLEINLYYVNIAEVMTHYVRRTAFPRIPW